ncbi:Uncharacterized protein family UPF0005 containing protein [Aphelenchoides avenae]|nr:Uncharacterized protein family UPF0005 containing protein [Aphelenchus avenae]
MPEYYSNEVGMHGAPKDELGFSDKSIRAAFVRKVFALLMLMFGIVCLVAAVPFAFDAVLAYVRSSPIIGPVSVLVFAATYIPIACFPTLRRTHPWNMLTALLLTLSAGFLVMSITAYSGLQTAFIATWITFVACLITAISACQTTVDLTRGRGFGLFFFLVLVVATLVGTACVFALKVRALYATTAAAAAVVLMLYMAKDLQLILGGKRCEVSPEEYVYAAVQLFIDIMLIFVFVFVIVIVLALASDNNSCDGGGDCSCGNCCDLCCCDCGGGGSGGCAGGKKAENRAKEEVAADVYEFNGASLHTFEKHIKVTPY